MFTTSTTALLGSGGGILDTPRGTLGYETLVESTVVHSPGGATATVVTTTHRRTDAAASGRPVVFAFNGGPGAASGFLGIGFLGPVRLDVPDELDFPTHPPFSLGDNSGSPLDVCDIVLIDPPGTGLGRVEAPDGTPEFYSVDGDARALLAVIADWCERHDRENSPRYLLGESYGTIRAVAILGASVGGPVEGGRLTGIGFNGAILLGSGLHLGRSLHGDLDVVLSLPSLAATARYHGVAGTSRSLVEHVDEARALADGELLRALHRGRALPRSERDALAERVSGLIGVPPARIARHELRLATETFVEELLPDRRVGIYDSRFTSAAAATGGDPVADDPAMGRYSAAFAHASRAQLRALGVEGTKDYRTVDFAEVNGSWDWGSGAGVFAPHDFVQRLAVVMERDPRLRVLFGTGYYDLATPLNAAHYCAAHATADSARVTSLAYESGHMPFLGNGPSSVVAADLRAFVQPADRAGAVAPAASNEPVGASDEADALTRS